MITIFSFLELSFLDIDLHAHKKSVRNEPEMGLRTFQMFGDLDAPFFLVQGTHLCNEMIRSADFFR